MLNVSHSSNFTSASEKRRKIRIVFQEKLTDSCVRAFGECAIRRAQRRQQTLAVSNKLTFDKTEKNRKLVGFWEVMVFPFVQFALRALVERGVACGRARNEVKGLVGDDAAAQRVDFHFHAQRNVGRKKISNFTRCRRNGRRRHRTHLFRRNNFFLFLFLLFFFFF